MTLFGWLGSALLLGAEPVELQHKFGVTVIDEVPERVVSVSYIGHDFILALGVRPVGLRHWYGDHPFGVWPWAQPSLGDAEPVVLYGDIDVEQIALLEPDLIEGQWSGMTEQQYRLLSRIAPTLPPDAGETDYSSSWQKMLDRLGQALGRQAEADAVIERLNGRFADARASHPEWEGKGGAVVWAPRISAFAGPDLRGRFLADLGFAVPDAVDDLARNGNFFVSIPPETLEPIDTDLLIWLHSHDLETTLEAIRLRPMMRAHQERREVAIDDILSAALSHSSPLSLDFALDHLVPVIAAAADGDGVTHARTDHAYTLGGPDD